MFQVGFKTYSIIARMMIYGILLISEHPQNCSNTFACRLKCVTIQDFDLITLLDTVLLS